MRNFHWEFIMWQNVPHASPPGHSGPAATRSRSRPFRSVSRRSISFRSALLRYVANFNVLTALRWISLDTHTTIVRFYLLALPFPTPPSSTMHSRPREHDSVVPKSSGAKFYKTGGKRILAERFALIYQRKTSLYKAAIFIYYWFLMNKIYTINNILYLYRNWFV